MENIQMRARVYSAIASILCMDDHSAARLTDEVTFEQLGMTTTQVKEMCSTLCDRKLDYNPRVVTIGDVVQFFSNSATRRQ